MEIMIQGLSIVGAGLILVAFFCLQRSWWTSDERAYLWTNLVGAVLLALVALWDRRAGFVLLEVAWALVSVASLARARRHPSDERIP